MVMVSPLLEMAGNCKYERNGKPLGSDDFIKTLEKDLGLILRPQSRDLKRSMIEYASHAHSPQLDEGSFN